MTHVLISLLRCCRSGAILGLAAFLGACSLTVSSGDDQNRPTDSATASIDGGVEAGQPDGDLDGATPSGDLAQPTASTTLTLKVAATRTSGTAPLAVLFDAIPTTSTAGVDTFRQIQYAFDFGDDRGLTWSVSGRPKNAQTGGPLAAHVFDVAGTFAVKVRATDAVGGVSEQMITIAVADADTAYAGTKTTCISTSADFTGCPSGATHQATMPSGTQWNGKRWLFHAGQDFTALGRIDIQDGNVGVQVGSFGAGAKPIVHSVGVGDFRPATANFAADIAIMGLQTTGDMSQAIGKRVLFYKNDLSGDAGFKFGDLGGWGLYDQYRSVPSNQFYNPTELFFVENTATGNTTANGGNAFGWGSRMAFLGNDFGVTVYHNLRVTQSYKSCFGHNRLRGVSSTGGYHAFKFHSCAQTNYCLDKAYDDDMVTSGGGWPSRYNVVADNEFGSAADNNGWITMFGPENDTYAEGVEDLIVENNRYVHPQSWQTDLLMTGRRITYRSNVHTDGSPMVYLFDQHGGGLPADWKGPYFDM